MCYLCVFLFGGWASLGAVNTRNHLHLSTPSQLALRHEVDLDGILVEDQGAPVRYRDREGAAGVLPLTH